MKKLIAVILSGFMLMNLFTVNVKAYDMNQTNLNYTAKNLKVLYDLWSGRITPSDAMTELEYLRLVYEVQLPDDDISQINSILPSIVNGLATADAGTMQYVLELLKVYGIDVEQYWKEYADEHNIEGESTIDMHGCPAVAIIPQYPNQPGYEYLKLKLYVDEGVILRKADGTMYFNSLMIVYAEKDDGYGYYETGSGYRLSQIYYPEQCELIGSWVILDEPTGDKTPVDCEQPEVILPAPEELPEDDLRDFLNELFKDIPFMFPDLSTIEGLLASICDMMAYLDRDNDAELLNSINLAICSLATDSRADSMQIVALLADIKDSIVNGSGNEQNEVYLEQLQNINKSLDYLCTINTLDFAGETLETVLTLTESEKEFLDEYSDFIITLMSKLSYYPVNSAIQSIESIILTTTPPADFTVEAFGSEITVLDADTVSGEGFKSGLNTAQAFVSVIVLASWLYSMRKKISGGGTA